MAQKLTQKYVASVFFERGYELLSEYKHSKVKLDYRCKNGHLAAITWSNLMSGWGCNTCAGHSPVGIEKAKIEFQKAGYTLLETEWVSSKVKLKFICSSGHSQEMRWDSFSRGARCFECVGKKPVGIERARKEFADEGYKLLTEKWENARVRLKYICPSGHCGGISWNNFQQGARCIMCADCGFNPEKPASLYYVRFVHEGSFYYKIGITNRSVTQRFFGEKLPYEVIDEKRFLFGWMAREEELRTLDKYRKYRVDRHKKRLLRSGNTEIFTKDVLGLDKSEA